ncbi:hypothetical protein IPP75_05275 [Candidatus Saccharibacteria bacterium]|nr:MAG: hypothetical protein IPP75_05275 [Candidatus Saccharibacteria bacterium]
MSERLVVLRPPEPSYSLRQGGAVCASRPDITGMTNTGHAHGADYYATDELIAELAGLGFPPLKALGNYFHVTNARALVGIARRGAIVSAKQLHDEGEEIRTGEYGEHLRQHKALENPHLHYPPRALSEVYGARSPNTSYTFERGSYGVWFGIDGSAVEAVVSGRPLSDYGDGIALGPEVKLPHVSSITVPYEQMDDMSQWANEHSPGARVLSSDACWVIMMGALQHVRGAESLAAN